MNKIVINLYALETDAMSKSCRVSRLQNIANENIKKINIEECVTHRMQIGK